MGHSHHSPIPLLWSKESLTRKEEELEELWDWDEFDRVVNLVTDDFFTVFCVAVRLHSKGKNYIGEHDNFKINRNSMVSL